jgi:hypothetical protein
MIRVLDNALIKLRWTCNVDLHGRENVGVGMDSVISCMAVERGSGGMKRAAMKVVGSKQYIRKATQNLNLSPQRPQRVV